MKRQKEPRLKNVRITKEKTEVDHSTGEVKKTNSEYSFKSPVEPNFVKIYLEDIAMMYQCSRPEIAVLGELLKLMEYNNKISLPGGAKIDIAAALGKTLNWVNICVAGLSKKQIIFKNSPGIYIMNSLLFGKGTWKDIREIQMSVTYNKDGRTIKTETEQEPIKII